NSRKQPKTCVWVSAVGRERNFAKVSDGVCFSAVCRFDQGAAVEGAGVGFLKNSVLNILFQTKEMPSEN
ncbi:TPA: hypothetical protein ACFN65_002019, partial [Neisseria meningitidis]